MIASAYSYVLHALDAVDAQARQQVAETEQRQREAAWMRVAAKRSAADFKRIMAARARRAARARLKRKRCERSSSNAGLRMGSTKPSATASSAEQPP